MKGIWVPISVELFIHPGVKCQHSCSACKRPHTANLTQPLHRYSDNVQAI